MKVVLKRSVIRCVISLTQVSLVATAPLTNLALAIRIDPTVCQKLKGLYIMGGNTECKSFKFSISITGVATVGYWIWEQFILRNIIQCSPVMLFIFNSISLWHWYCLHCMGYMLLTLFGLHIDWPTCWSTVCSNYPFPTARGNTTMCAEFNFACDPEAAYIVLNDYLCPTYIACWEFTCRSKLPWVSFFSLSLSLSLSLVKQYCPMKQTSKNLGLSSDSKMLLQLVSSTT